MVVDKRIDSADVSFFKLILPIFIISFLNYDTEFKKAPGKLYNKFVIVVASYNNSKYYKKNLNSILFQNYPSDCYRIIYTDDKSADNTYDLVSKYISEQKKQHAVTLYKNNKRKMALENHYNMISSCGDDEIIIMVDGDDWLINNNVLLSLNDVYQDENKLLVYGQFYRYSNRADTRGIGFSKRLPGAVIKNCSYRNYFKNNEFCVSHPKTFRKKLFNRVDPKLLKNDNGVFFYTSGDVALMCALLEEAQGKIFFMNKILYGYNAYSSINDWKVFSKKGDVTRSILNL